MAVFRRPLEPSLSAASLEDLYLHLQAALVTAQLGQFLVLVGRRARPRPVVDVGLVDPVPKTRLRDRLILPDSCDGLRTQPGQLDDATTALLVGVV